MPLSLRRLLAIFAAGLLVSSPGFPYQTPLSDESVREAYFLGQRRDESMVAFLNKYTKFLPLPKSGPHIHSITLLTPFAFLVQYSSQQLEYSAQRAALDHKSQGESVEITIEILLTATYGSVTMKPTNSPSAAPFGAQFRSSDFWRSFKIQVFDGDKQITTDDFTGVPQYANCSEDGGCSLSGATVHLRFPAEAFTSDSATIQVDPPEGDPVSVDFNLVSLR